MKSMGDEEFILTIGTAMIPMIIGLAYIVAPDFTRYFFGRQMNCLYLKWQGMYG